MLNNLTTETRNKNTMNLDTMSISELCQVMNAEDQKSALAVRECLPEIENAIFQIKEAFKRKGRLIYLGAGTSGRIGVLDAVECVPTFGVPDTMVVGLIAGGEKAFIRAVEGAEDSKELAVEDLKKINFNKNDILVGIAASGRTPYVIGGLEYAKSIDARTVAVSCNKDSLVGDNAEIRIEPEPGPEILTGSTRLKSGTCQKLVLNMLSTGAMIQIGKVYGNLMVDVQMTNEKLVERGKNIIIQSTKVDYKAAEKYLSESKNNPKVAIVMIMNNCSYIEAIERLKMADGFISKTIL